MHYNVPYMTTLYYADVTMMMMTMTMMITMMITLRVD